MWHCTKCGNEIKGGLVFVTGISGSGVEEHLRKVVEEAHRCGHPVEIFDIGKLMYEFALKDDPEVNWNMILNADEKTRRLLRMIAFKDLSSKMKENPETLYIVDLHLSFRWKPFLTKGFEPHILKEFLPWVRCFINIVEDIDKVQVSLSDTAWGKRKTLELLIWRDEELFFTDILANMCDRINSFVIAAGEPPLMLEKIIWHPEVKKIYLSFPITHILDDPEAKREIISFRDKLREKLVVFDPYASKDYDDTYKKPEMKAIREEVGEVTKDRDFRFIDQADAVVVYFPKKVPSKGVDAEMNHARLNGKPIFLYSPEDIGGGPFSVPPDHTRSDKKEYLDLVFNKLC